MITIVAESNTGTLIFHWERVMLEEIRSGSTRSGSDDAADISWISSGEIPLLLVLIVGRRHWKEAGELC